MKKIWFGLLAVLIFGLFGCGGDSSGSAVSGGGGGGGVNQIYDFTASGTSSTLAIPSGGPYTLLVSGTSTIISAPVTSRFSVIDVTGTSVDGTISGPVDSFSSDGTAATFIFNSKVNTAIITSTSNILWFYGDVGIINNDGTSCTVHLPVNSQAVINNSGTGFEALYDLPAIP